LSRFNPARAQFSRDNTGVSSARSFRATIWCFECARSFSRDDLGFPPGTFGEFSLAFHSKDLDVSFARAQFSRDDLAFQIFRVSCARFNCIGASLSIALNLSID